MNNGHFGFSFYEGGNLMSSIPNLICPCKVNQPTTNVCASHSVGLLLLLLPPLPGAIAQKLNFGMTRNINQVPFGMPC